MSDQVHDSVRWHIDHRFAASAVIPGFLGPLASFLLLDWSSGRKGVWNWCLLTCAAFCTSIPGIWCMHFIATSSIILDGVKDQFKYSTGFLIASALCPLPFFLAIFFGFGWTVDGKVNIIHFPWIVSFAPASILSMHYAGQEAIANYQNIYSWRWALGSAIGALVLSVAAMGLFFFAEYKWTNTTWKRVACALAMDCGIHVMHWLAMQGTSYEPKNVTSDTISKENALIVAVAISAASCAVPVTIGYFTNRARRRNERNSRQLMIALAFFDSSDRLLVTATTDSILSRKVADYYIKQSSRDEFFEGHRLFTDWFRLSRNWQLIADWMPTIRDDVRRKEGAVQQTSIDGYDPGDREKYSFNLMERFCVAVEDLALATQMPLSQMGILYSAMMDTGTSLSHTALTRIKPLWTMVYRTPTSFSDITSWDRFDPTRGKMMFLVRKLSYGESAHLRSLGFKFAVLSPYMRVHLARALHVPVPEFDSLFRRLNEYPMNATNLSPGVYLACLALRAEPGGKPQILVPRSAPDILPLTPIQSGPKLLTPWQQSMLERHDDELTSTLMDWLEFECSKEDPGPRKMFLHDMFNAFKGLQSRLGLEIMSDTRLIATAQHIPWSTALNGHDHALCAQIVVIGGFIDLHRSIPTTSDDEWVPISLFRASQHAAPTSVGGQWFEQFIAKEFRDVANRQALDRMSTRGTRLGSSANPFAAIWSNTLEELTRKDDGTDHHSLNHVAAGLQMANASVPSFATAHTVESTELTAEPVSVVEDMVTLIGRKHNQRATRRSTRHLE